MGTVNSRREYADTSSSTNNAMEADGIGGNLKIDTVSSKFELGGMNKRVEINMNSGLVHVSGINNQVFIKDNYGKVVVDGINNRVTIERDFGDGRVESGGSGNSVTTHNRMPRPINPPPVAGNSNNMPILPPERSAARPPAPFSQQPRAFNMNEVQNFSAPLIYPHPAQQISRPAPQNIQRQANFQGSNPPIPFNPPQVLRDPHLPHFLQDNPSQRPPIQNPTQLRPGTVQNLRPPSPPPQPYDKFTAVESATLLLLNYHSSPRTMFVPYRDCSAPFNSKHLNSKPHRSRPILQVL